MRIRVVGLAVLSLLLSISAVANNCYEQAAKDRVPPDTVEIFSGAPRLIVVHGYSTSFGWPDRLKRKIDRYMDGRDVIEVKKATRSSTPVARWMNVETGAPKQPWKQVRDTLATRNGRPAIVLAQQSLQWVYGDRTTGIRSRNDRERIRRGADVLERYARRLLDDGADEVFIATHIYKKPMEPQIGNERLALEVLAERSVPRVHAGPDVWTPTKEHFPEAYAEDRIHPGPIGEEIMAQHWFERLLEFDGRDVPGWSRKEMRRRIDVDEW